MNTVIAVDKELYEAVLRNSARVNDLEAENYKLKEINLWHSEKSWNCEKEKQQLKELLLRCKRNFDEITKFCNDEIKYAHEKTDNFCIPAEGLAVIQSSSNNKELLTKIDEVLK